VLLIVAKSNDPHVDAVGALLIDKGLPYKRINLEEYLKTFQIDLDLGPSGSEAELVQTNEHFPFHEISSVWFRPPLRPFINQSITQPGVAVFIRDETQAFLAGLWRLLADRFWVSPAHAVTNANNKIYQLQQASAIGLAIPKTLITTNPARALAFYEECNRRMITKVLHRNIVDHGQSVSVVWTNEVTEEHVKLFGSISCSPTLFQEYVPKRYELRITVVGQQVFACAIHSQAASRTEVDWRRYDVDIPYEAIELPTYIEDQCRRLVAELGLQFGAIDMILRPDGSYVFLEINPTGAWLWIQQKTGLRINEAIVDLLTGRGQAG
jgi:glutathione synthase/RimK-type ligase-like ATP-grasp enzyme